MLKPELRQNFTIDQNVLSDAAKALEVEKDDTIVEIGAGKGVLTRKILGTLREYSSKQSYDLTQLLSYEVDEDLREDLEDIKYKNHGLFDYRLQNFLEAKPKKGFNKSTGNIPYHISEVLFFRLIEWDFDRIVFVTGIKFARKVCGEIPGKLATIAQSLFESEIQKEYDKNIFFPKSKVDSALLVMTRKRNFTSKLDEIIAEVMCNTHQKHAWLNKKLGFTQSQTGQIYHMDLDKLINEIKAGKA